MDARKGANIETSPQAIGLRISPILYAAFLVPILLLVQRRLRGKRKSSITIPYSVPFLRSTIPFAFDGLNFLSNASRQFRSISSVIRICLVQDEIYLVQGRKNVTSMFTNASMTVTKAYSFALKHCFGMAQPAVDVYLADTSGSRAKPIRGSRVEAGQRISYLTHENLIQGLLLTGLDSTSFRLQDRFRESLSALRFEDEWIEMPDLADFLQQHLGKSIIQAVFGPTILELNPGFVEDLWEFDKGVMDLARRFPWFWIPRAYHLRGKLRDCVKKWHAYATSHFLGIESHDEAEVNRIWGSHMMKDRYASLLGIDGQTPDSVASTDLALIWATITNVVPSSTTMALQVFRNKQIRAELRESLKDTFEPHSQMEGMERMKKLEKDPLLLSLYAETLRFGVQIHVPRTSPHQALTIDKALIPQNKFIMMNTWLAHTDEEVWNTRNGQYPLDSFWPRRFLVDPTDPLSGPTKPAERPKTNTAHDQAYFSTEGLEGAWIPYGGGHHACPGRLLAKRIMLLTTAILTSMYDIELQVDEFDVQFASPRFGFGVRKPKDLIPFRIRRRDFSLDSANGLVNVN